MPLRKPCLKCSIHVRRGEPGATQYHPERAVIFHYGREQAVVLEEVDEAQMLLLSLLNGQRTFEEIVTLTQKQYPNVTSEEVGEVLDQLTHYGLLEDASILPPTNFSPGYVERYMSQLQFLSLVDRTGTQKYLLQSRLKNARVAVLGLGGLGSNVLIGLAAIGIGFLRGVDYDQVTLGNLNRQVLYDLPDLGAPKVQAAAQHLARFHPEVIFEAIEHQIKRPEEIAGLIRDVDLVAFCADRPLAIGRWMNQAALETGIPCIVGGYHGICAEVGPFVVPFETSCLRCGEHDLSLQEQTLPELAWVNDAYRLRHPNIHFITALAANLICCEIYKQITKVHQPMTYNTRYLLDSEQFTLKPLPHEREADCRACGSDTIPRCMEGFC